MHEPQFEIEFPAAATPADKEAMRFALQPLGRVEKMNIREEMSILIVILAGAAANLLSQHGPRAVASLWTHIQQARVNGKRLPTFRAFQQPLLNTQTCSQEELLTWLLNVNK